MTRPKWPRDYARIVFDSSGGACHHCKADLRFEPRSGWHIDHHPVAYRDIEDQCCFGVTDPLDLSNLVASCPSCNMGHAHEKERWCGRTQFPCKKRFFRRGMRAFLVLCLMGASFSCGWFLSS